MGHISLHLCMPSNFFIFYYKLDIVNFTLDAVYFRIPINNLQLFLGTHLNYLEIAWSFQILILRLICEIGVLFQLQFISHCHIPNPTIYQYGCAIHWLMCFPHVASLPTPPITWRVSKELGIVFLACHTLSHIYPTVFSVHLSSFSYYTGSFTPTWLRWYLWSKTFGVMTLKFRVCVFCLKTNVLTCPQAISSLKYRFQVSRNSKVW